MFQRWMGMLPDSAADNAKELASQLTALDALAGDLASLDGLIDTSGQQEDGVDLFELLNLWWQEDIHSRLLTWLLAPKGSHGLGDYFLTGFLLHSTERARNIGTPTVAEDRIRGMDWSGAASEREWYTVVDGGGGWLDILVVNEALKTMCAIENKILSPESGRQLTFYQKAIERDYCAFDRHYVFLSPTGMAPQQEEDRSTWTPVSYDAVLDLVERAMAEHEDDLHPNVQILLRQYADTLRRRIVPVPSDVQKRAREIYIANRDAIELAYQHKPDYYGETVQCLRKVIEDQEGWQLGLATNGYLRFGSVDWTTFERLQTGNAFAAMNDLLQFQFYITDQVVQFQLVLYPGDDADVRQRICHAAREAGNLFSVVSEVVPAGSVVLYDGGSILDADDYMNWDDPPVCEKVSLWAFDFAANQFPAMNEVIVQCLRSYADQ